MGLVKVATVWLGGCSGCHMSFLDMDEFLIELAGLIELVYSPIADIKEYPHGVDVALVEGAVANTENLHVIRTVRERTRTVISFGDCAVTGNVTAMRNPLGSPLEVLEPAYIELADVNRRIPDDRAIVPELLERVLPVHAVIPVEYYLPGCPPPAPRIRAALEKLLGLKKEEVEGQRFG